ncbi:MAG: nucleotidyltransferase domain-containing protein [Clostridium sp.]|nr:nucleotidyltransferase domain-containing protein [Clostridium sp.]
MNQQDSMELKKIADTVCSVVEAEKIYLFGSFAYGIPKKDSDFDIYVLLADGSERPLKAIQKINIALARMDIRPVDILADTSTRFYEKCKEPTLERTIIDKGVPLYESLYPSNRQMV